MHLEYSMCQWATLIVISSSSSSSKSSWNCCIVKYEEVTQFFPLGLSASFSDFRLLIGRLPLAESRRILLDLALLVGEEAVVAAVVVAVMLDTDQVKARRKRRIYANRSIMEANLLC